MSPPPSSPLEKIRAKASALGFDALGVAEAKPLDVEWERYRAFVAAEMHGTMRYLKEDAEVRRRVDTEHILEGARSVLCLARRYPASDEGAGVTARAIARYARGADYHNFIRKKLRRLAAFVRTLPGPDGLPSRARPLIDDAPILERAWAARSGLGFIGKNGLLIVPGQGSFVLLGEVVTTLPLPPGEPLAERCGACTLCLDACPTKAFVKPFVLDARACVAYLTIELRGDVPEPLREGIGEHLFGCDDCQTVCPFNTSARSGTAGKKTPFDPRPPVQETPIASLLAGLADGAGVLEDGSPLKRAGAFGLARNAAIVLGNRRDLEALPELERASATHPSPVVREAARWAVRQMKP